MINGYVLSIGTLIVFGAMIYAILVGTVNFINIKESFNKKVKWKAKVDFMLEKLEDEVLEIEQLDKRVTKLEREMGIVKKLNVAFTKMLISEDFDAFDE